MVTYRKPPAHHEATKDTMSPRCRLRTRKEITLPIHGCRGARRPRREERAYRAYVSDEQRRPPGWIGSQNGNVISFRVLRARCRIRRSRVAPNGAALPGAEPRAVTRAFVASIPGSPPRGGVAGWGCSAPGPACGYFRNALLHLSRPSLPPRHLIETRYRVLHSTALFVSAGRVASWPAKSPVPTGRRRRCRSRAAASSRSHRASVQRM